MIVFAVNAFWQLSAFALVDLSAKTRPYLLHLLQNDCRLSSDPTFPTFSYFFDPAPTIPTFILKFLLFPTFSYCFYSATSTNCARLPCRSSE